MTTYAHSDHSEADRLTVLQSYGLLKTGDPAFDRLTRLAAEMCGTSMALVSLLDEDSQWYLSTYGVDPPPTSRENSFCRKDLAAGDVLMVPDARFDVRIADNPVVVAAPFIRFYAGAPLITPDGFVLGRFSVLDTEPRVLTETQQEHLRILADEVMAQLTLRRQASALTAEVAARRESEAAAARSERLLRDVLSHPDTVFFAKDLEGRFILANTAMDDLFRVAHGGLLGRLDTEVLPGPAAELLRANDREVAQSGERLVVIEPVPQRDGTIREFRSLKFPLRDDSGKIYAVAGMSMDSTAQLAAERSLRDSERRWHQLFSGSPVAIGVSDENGVFVEVNAAMCALMGRTEAQLIGHQPAEFTHPDEESIDLFEMIDAAPDGVASLEKRYIQPDGDIRWVWLKFAETPGPAGRRWILGHAQDITERVATERAVKESEANLSAVAEVVALIQSGGDPRQTIVNAGRDLASAAFASLFELDAAGTALRATATTLAAQVDLSLPLRLPSAAVAAFSTGEVVFLSEPATDPRSSMSAAGTAGPGSIVFVPVRSGPRTTAVLVVGWSHQITGLDDRRIRVISLLADQAGVALRQVALLSELEELALTDPLTGLPNRRSWDQTLASLLGTGAGRQLCVALADLDHFKRFNDSHGHAAGDDFLRMFAEHARGVIRVGDTVARWGGEEFALALPDCAEDTAYEVLERIRRGVPAGQTCSVGYAVWDGDESADELIGRVDAALYVAKRAGRNRIRPARAHESS